MKKKLLVFLCTLVGASSCALGFTACFGNSDDNKGGGGNGGPNTDGGGNSYTDGHVHIDETGDGDCDKCGLPFDVLIDDIKMDKEDVELEVGGRETLTVNISFDKLMPVKVTQYIWESTDESVATVNNGVVTAVGAGYAEIIVRVPGCYDYANCHVTVTKPNVPVEGVTLDKEELTLDIGGTATLQATVLPADASNKKLIWSSSAEGKVSVREGEIKALSAGTATITVRTQDGNKSATCTVTVKGLEYSAISEDGEIIAYNLKSIGTIDDSEIVIPETFKEKPVTAIEDNAFKNCGDITSVTIPDSITSIGEGAFSGCGKLAIISIPKGVTSIGDEAFKDCGNLGEITIPDSITSIGDDAFSGCDKISFNEYGNALYLGNKSNPYTVLVKAKNTEITSCAINEKTKLIAYSAFNGCDALTGIVIPDSVIKIGHEAFRNCKGLETVKIGNGVTEIEGYAFNGCTALNSLTIGEKVEKIGLWAFTTCKSLETVILPDSVKDIESYAFAGCQKLTSINIPKGVKKIDVCMFESCTSLESIELPDSITSISVLAFKDCSSLKSVTIPESVTFVGAGVFYGCTALETVKLNTKLTSLADYRLSGNDYGFFENCSSLIQVSLPDGVTEIGSRAFRGCSSLKSITIGANNSKYSSQDGILYNKEKTSFVHIPQAVENVTIPETITKIPDNAFKVNVHLAAIVFSDGLISIGKNAFEGCTGLKDLTIPESVTDIGNNAFKNCTVENATLSSDVLSFISFKSIKTVVITSGEEIYFSLQGCENLTSVTIPASIKRIYANAFKDCTALKEVHITDLAKWCAIDFENEYANPLHYAHDLYIEGQKVTELQIPDGVTTIKYCAFENSSVTSVKLPDSVTKIEQWSFKDCSALASINIPDGVTYIGGYAFYECGALESIDIPDGVTYIGLSAFDGCSKIKTISIPDSVTYIGSGAFDNCNLTYNEYDNALYLGNKTNPYVVLIKAKNKQITSCVINEKTKFIYAHAFENCLELESVSIPDGLIDIDGYAFGNDNALQYNEYDNALYLGNSANPYLVLMQAKSKQISSCNIHEDTRIINTFAFSECINLTSIIIPDGVITVGEYAFAWCDNAKSVTIPDSVTLVGGNAFVNCNGIESLVAPALALPEIPNTSFKTVVITSGDKIGDAAFFDCKYLVSITLPDTIDIIGSSAFASCTNLKSITLPEGIKVIGNSAFMNCTGLTSIVVPDGVTEIGANAFASCNNLTNVTIPGSVQYISCYFSACTNFKSLTFKGTKEEWEAIEKSDDWADYINDFVIHCTDGDIEIKHV